MPTQSNSAPLMQELIAARNAFFDTDWDESASAQDHRFTLAMKLLTIERRQLREAVAREEYDHVPHLSLMEMCAIYVCIVKIGRISTVMQDFFDAHHPSLIYQTLRGIKPSVRLSEINEVKETLDGIGLDEIMLMLEYVPEAKGQEDHQAYTGFLEHVRNVKHGHISDQQIKMLFRVAEELYRILIKEAEEKENHCHFEHRSSVADRLKPHDHSEHSSPVSV